MFTTWLSPLRQFTQSKLRANCGAPLIKNMIEIQNNIAHRLPSKRRCLVSKGVFFVEDVSFAGETEKKTDRQTWYVYL